MNADLTTNSVGAIKTTTPTEKALVEVLQSALAQYKSLDEAMTDFFEVHEGNKRKESYYGDKPLMWESFTDRIDKLSRTKEREFRQFVTALQTLKQLQAPPLQVNIKAQSAYVAQNQQNNLEINDPQ